MYRIDTRQSVINEIQRYLASLGYRDYPVIPNGVYDSNTREAVRRFQSESALSETGIVDYETFIRLYKKYKDITFKNELRKRDVLGIKFPITPGETREEMLYINRLIASLLDNHGIYHRIRKNDYFSRESEAGVLALKKIFGMSGDGIINEYFYSRMLSERKSIEEIADNYGKE